MTNNLKKSLFVGLAALSFVSVASATNASAKSYAKVTSNNTLTTDPTTRNFESTGSNALMTKAGTVKGAKTVASKATMSSLANSKKSANYFRAYREATTNRGTKYYKVVSMDGKYRGWIYVGGVKSAQTTTEATVSDQVKNTKFYLKDASKNTLWDAPKFTQYKASKVGVGNVDTTQGFFADGAVTKTREGSLYYHVKAVSNNNVSGWIYVGKAQFGNSSQNVVEDFGGLSTTPSSASANQNNSVNVQFKDSYGNVLSDLGTYTYVTKSSNTVKDGSVDSSQANSKNYQNKTDLAQLNYEVSNYAKNKGYNVEEVSSAQYGHTYRVVASKTATSKVQFYANSKDSFGQPSAKQLTASSINGGYPVFSSNQVATALTGSDNKTITGNSGASGDNKISSADGSIAQLLSGYKANVENANEGVLYSNTMYNTSDSAQTVNGVSIPAKSSYYFEYKFDQALVDGNAKFGNQVRAYYNETVKTGDAPKATSTTSTSNSYAN